MAARRANTFLFSLWLNNWYNNIILTLETLFFFKNCIMWSFAYSKYPVGWSVELDNNKRCLLGILNVHFAHTLKQPLQLKKLLSIQDKNDKIKSCPTFIWKVPFSLLLFLLFTLVTYALSEHNTTPFTQPFFNIYHNPSYNMYAYLERKSVRRIEWNKSKFT